MFSAGDQVVTAETEFGRVGLSICYDLRFPELYRSLAVQGADDPVRPSRVPVRDGRGSLGAAAARAIEDQAFVIAAAQWEVGAQGRERRNFGHSLVADPWGR